LIVVFSPLSITQRLSIQHSPTDPLRRGFFFSALYRSSLHDTDLKLFGGIQRCIKIRKSRSRPGDSCRHQKRVSRPHFSKNTPQV